MIEEVETGIGRLVILARRDLPWNVRCVQAAHAVANWAKACKMRTEEWGPYGPAFVLYGVNGAEEMEEWASRLEDSVLFCEPDLGGEPTALAWHGSGSLEGLHLL
jgi:hypothetical protein